MANIFYRNTNVKISFDVLDENNNLVGLSTQKTVYWFIKSPDNFIYSNDPNVSLYSYSNGVGIYTSVPVVQEEKPGVYYITYIVTKNGDYKYKFQVVDNTALVNIAVSGDIKVQDDGIF